MAYEWGLKFELNTAGWILPGAVRHVEIPFDAVGDPHQLGAILAHELCHAWIDSVGLVVADTEDEPVTDLATFATGLGVLTLSCLEVGYLPLPLKVKAFAATNARHGVKAAEAEAALSPQGRRAVQALS